MIDLKCRVQPAEWVEIQTSSYHAFFAALGYESRARYVFENFLGNAENRVICDFGENPVLDFNRNKYFFEDRDFKSISAISAEVRKWTQALSKYTKENLKILVDISSLSRNLIAALCYYAYQIAKERGQSVEVDFVYSLAKFGNVPSTFGPLTYNGPAIPELGGWSDNPRKPCGVVLGIGYEEDLALGVLEELEASRVWAFRPKDHDPKYDLEIDTRNRGLFEDIPPNSLIFYSVYDPYALFTSVEALIASTKRKFRIIITPFGPKIFSLASCLATIRHYPEVGFWRVSGGANLQPVDRVASGTILALRATFAPEC